VIRPTAATTSEAKPAEPEVEFVKLDVLRTGLHASSAGLLIARDGRGMRALLTSAGWRDLSRRAASVADALDHNPALAPQPSAPRRTEEMQ
jgi:hypothetical protein